MTKRRTLHHCLTAAVILIQSHFFQAPLLPQSMGFSTVEEYAFQPADDEGYLQAWNVNFQGNGYYIYINYVIGNAGPGSLNNGVNVLVLHNGKQRLFVEERSQRSLIAVPGKYGHKSGRNELSFDGTYHARIDIKDLKIDLTLRPLMPGVRLSGGNIAVNAGEVIRADIPVPSALAEGSITIDGVESPLKGLGGMEYLRTNSSPHTYAKRFLLLRTYNADSAFFLGGFFGTSKFPGGNLMLAGLVKKGVFTMQGRVASVEFPKKEIDPISGYEVPVETIYHIAHPECTVKEDRQYMTGGFYVIGHVSALLRWVVTLFFARPFILHYSTKTTVECAGWKAPEVFQTESTYYMINE
ncbi:MAG: hypothetical protein HY042_01445 [Spirochaetia bacterium]|nr:hypothetical protein [Spirochaetia bacterium]